MDSLVQLNVGGVYFPTRRQTLSCNETFFAGVLRAHPECFEIFIDRDPTHFRYVLNWLRGARCLPEDEISLRELLCEADYYSMADMRDAIVHAKDRHSWQKSLRDIADELRQAR